MRSTRITESIPYREPLTQLSDQGEVQPTTKIFLESFAHARTHQRGHVHLPLPSTRAKLFTLRHPTSRILQTRDPESEQLSPTKGNILATADRKSTRLNS